MEAKGVQTVSQRRSPKPKAYGHSLIEQDVGKGSIDAEGDLPTPDGDTVTLTETIPVPVDKYPDYNFAGRILGPRGMTVKQLEQRTGCRILVRGRGSLKNPPAKGTTTKDDLHVVVIAEDSANRAKFKMDRAKEELSKLLNPGNEGMDDLKKKQLMELAIINGTYRPPPHLTASSALMNTRGGGQERPSIPLQRTIPRGFSTQIAPMNGMATTTVAPGHPQIYTVQEPNYLPGAPQAFTSGMTAAQQPYILAPLQAPQMQPAYMVAQNGTYYVPWIPSNGVVNAAATPQRASSVIGPQYATAGVEHGGTIFEPEGTDTMALNHGANLTVDMSSVSTGGQPQRLDADFIIDHLNSLTMCH